MTQLFVSPEQSKILKRINICHNYLPMAEIYPTDVEKLFRMCALGLAQDLYSTIGLIRTDILEEEYFNTDFVEKMNRGLLDTLYDTTVEEVFME
jgi:hypothetical protein